MELETNAKHESLENGQPDPRSLILEFSDDEMSSTEEEDNDGTHSDDDLAYYERAIQEIARGDTYTCMICTVEMDYNCQMYACKHCYRVFDYDCIREWAVKSTQKTVDKIWKCPNCYHTSKKVPTNNRATCWCGKVVNPEPNPLNPNSCGQTCDYNTCVHGCSKICHLGPHPECTRTITLKCNCGKHTKDIFCYQRKSLKGKRSYQCNEPCGLLLACGIHKCQKKCHSGLCGTCPETLVATQKDDGTTNIKCYCGLHSVEKIKCKDVKICSTTKASKDRNGNKWIGVYSCGEMRSVEYRCHKHSFVEDCSGPPTISGSKKCPFSPELLNTCPCGRTELSALAEPRTACTDPIPHCEARCDKPLKCGKHRCPYTCHDGECMDPCIQIDKVFCSCHQTKYLVPCQFRDEPHCNTKCESLMSCRRHRCVERCCPGRPLAEKRKKTLFRSSDINDETLVEAQHVCLKDCNLMLSCGIHQCQRKCHPGKCPPCLESDSNDLVCPCGKTIVPAPVRCGTKLPPCPFPCIKVIQGEYPCGHKPMPHTCHPLSQPCPPCTATVFKPCKCGKKQKVRAVCFQNDVSCGQVCGKQLDNCHHNCQKTCHLPGQCQTKCKQVCNLIREHCGHRCISPCHGKTPCPDFPCTTLVKINCRCGRQEESIVCGANSNNETSAKTAILECNEDCEVLKRHIQLKEAFGISEEKKKDHDEEAEKLGQLVQVANTFEELELPFVESTLVVYGKQERWCSQIEEILNNLVDDNSRHSLHFKPMKAPQRNFIHELAKAYNMYAESQDRDPKRSVFVKKNEDGSTTKPVLSLADVFPIYETFKDIQKEKKTKEFLARTTARLVNIRIEDDDGSEQFTPKYNGFLIKNLSVGTDEADLERLFGQYIKPTLIKSPQYEILPGTQTALIYPESYEAISENVERDLEMLVGHFDHMCKEEIVADSVELCSVEEYLPTQRLETPDIQESSVEPVL